MADSILPLSIDDYLQQLPIGSLDNAIADNLRGLNHRQMPGRVPSNRDHQGYTFFTRPQLNLRNDNLRMSRKIMSLMNDEPLSIQRYVRLMLDPRCHYDYYFDPRYVSTGIRADGIVDPRQAFIPVLTNNINSISGWPDFTTPTVEFEEGVYKEMYSFVDGVGINYEHYDIDCNFRNTRGDPIMYMFYIWCLYETLVFEGRLTPYPDFIIERELDYTTRIYRVILDQHKNTVTKIFDCGAAFPIAVGIGAFADFNREKPYFDQIKDISIRMRCMGMRTFDELSIYDFNEIVRIFCPEMKDRKSMTKIPTSLLVEFNNKGYPRIDPDTHEMQWWIDTAYFNDKLNLILQHHIGLASFSDN
jgi:hypothetical protein